MKNTLLLFILLLPASFSYAQNKQKAEKLVARGIAYNDEGQYAAAISKYDEALKLDTDNLAALAEKALTLYNLKSYNETVGVCKKAIRKHPYERALKAVYVTYGSALDALGKTVKSLQTYDEGIKLFPDFYELYFNKGITFIRNQNFNASLECLQKAVILNPQHASSHNAIARVLYPQNKKIPSLLALCRFLMIEPKGNRGKINLQLLQKIIKGGAKKTGKNNVTLNLDPKILEESAAESKKKENDFSKTEVMLNFSAALDYSDTNANKTAVEQFIRKFKLICASLAEHQKDNFGFYWTYYVPYFIEMKNKKLITSFAYMIFAAQKEYATRWTTAHQAEMAKLYAWNKLYSWPGKLH